MATPAKKKQPEIPTSQPEGKSGKSQDELLNAFVESQTIYSNYSVSSGNDQEFRIAFGDEIPGKKVNFKVSIVMPLSLARRLAASLPQSLAEIDKAFAAKQGQPKKAE